VQWRKRLRRLAPNGRLLRLDDGSLEGVRRLDGVEFDERTCRLRELAASLVPVRVTGLALMLKNREGGTQFFVRQHELEKLVVFWLGGEGICGRHLPVVHLGRVRGLEGRPSYGVPCYQRGVLHKKA